MYQRNSTLLKKNAKNSFIHFWQISHFYITKSAIFRLITVIKIVPAAVFSPNHQSVLSVLFLCIIQRLFNNFLMKWLYIKGKRISLETNMFRFQFSNFCVNELIILSEIAIHTLMILYYCINEKSSLPKF